MNSTNNKLKHQTVNGLNSGVVLDFVVLLFRVEETSVITSDNSPSQDYSHPNNQTTQSAI